MRQVTRLCSLLVAVFSLLTVSEAAAQSGSQGVPDAQFGDLLFKVPTGWNPVEKEATFLIVAPALRPGSLTFIALASNMLDGNLSRSFDQLLTGFRSSYRIIQQSQISPISDTDGNKALYATAIALDQGGKQWSAYLVGVQYRERFESIIFMSDIPPGATYDAYFKVFQNFVASLSIGEGLPGSKIPGKAGPGDPGSAGTAAGSRDKETRSKLAPGALEGIYVAFSLGSGGKVGFRRLIFNPDGWVVKDIPQEGMIGFDFTAYRNDPHMNRNFIGRYHVDGGKINIDWQDFRGPAYPPGREVVQCDEVSGHPGWDTFIPVCRCTGKKLTGKYIWGANSADQYLQFFLDGTFVDHRVTDQLIVPSAFYSNPRIQRGTYSIQDQTLIFYFSDGHRGMRTFMAPKAQENQTAFDWIGLGWQQLYEEHYKAKLGH